MLNDVWESLRKSISGLLSNKSRKRSRRRGRNALSAEHLERRELFSVNQITFDAASSAVVVQGSADADDVLVWTDTNNLYVRLRDSAGTSTGTFAKSTVAMVTFDGGDGNDVFNNTTSVASSGSGGAGNDTLIGGSSVDIFSGGLGDDVLTGNTGNDELRGDDGKDRLSGSAGNDLLDGGVGVDTLLGGEGDDTLIGGSNDDELRGEEGNDMLTGNGGNDTLDGGAGDDRQFGGAGDDTLSGNIGNDELRGEDGNDRLTGAAGIDLLDGGAGNDLLFGGADNDVLVGGANDDELRGEDGNDVLFGSTGNDLLDGAAGEDRAFGGAGNDTLNGATGNDELRGEDGNDTLTGSVGNDTLDGGAGIDLLLGGADNDVLIGGADDDELRGEDGKDMINAGSGNDFLDGGAGDDRHYGGTGDDTFAGNDGNDSSYGEAGVDRMWGGAGRDYLSGGADGDFLYGGTDNDVLVGDEGNDELRGEDHNDLLFGGIGNDLLYGIAGDDVLVAEDGDDLVDGGVGNDVVIGGEGTDTLNGQAGEDVLIGGTTSYDNDPARLYALLNAWAAPMPYETRIERLEREGFAARLMATETVHEDAVADTIFGGDDQDWFLETGFMGVYVPHDVHNHEHGDEEEEPTDHHHAGPIILDHPPELEGFALVSAIDKISDKKDTEALQSLLPHSDDRVLQREHLTLFELVRYDEVTHYALHDGAWSDPATWHDGVVPTEGAQVLIPLGVEVTVDAAVTTRLESIRVDGTLSFDATQNTELWVDTIIVSSTGAFEMGTVEAPIMEGVTAKLIITDDGPIDRVKDPFALGRGLISHGSVSIHGAEVTSHVALAVPAVANATNVLLKEVPVGWKVGDTIVVAATSPGAEQNEVRTINAIVGNRVYLNQRLTYSHSSPSIELEVHVAHVTRNAVIESESTATDRRGHVMFMHNRNVDIAYAGFYKLGRTDKLQPLNDSVVGSDWSLEAGTGTNQRARYPVHFHRNGQVNDGNPSVVRGSAVVDAPGWGFVNHSSYVDFVDNVAYDVIGAGFSTEVGDEIGSFRDNIAIGSTGSSDRVEERVDVQDFGHRGDGFWFQGVGVRVTGNIAAGNDGSAFTYYGRALIEGGVRKEFLSANLPDPSIANGAETIDVGKMPVVEFEDNVGYASTFGLGAWYLMENADAGSDYNVLQNATLWNNSIGVEIPYVRHTILRNLNISYSNPETPADRGVRGNAVTTDLIFENLTITGYPTGIAMPWYGNVEVRGGFYHNTRDFLIQTGYERNILITGLTEIPSIVMVVDYNKVGSHGERLVTNDVVTLDFGPFGHKRVYYTQQHADFIPFTEPQSGLDGDYVGLTNAELWAEHGVALGGAVAPSNAYTLPDIMGLIEL